MDGKFPGMSVQALILLVCSFPFIKSAELSQKKHRLGVIHKVFLKIRSTCADDKLYVLAAKVWGDIGRKTNE